MVRAKGGSWTSNDVPSIEGLASPYFEGLDPEFFIYGEVTELFLRAIKGSASESVALDKKTRLLDGQIRRFRSHFSSLGFERSYQAIKVGIAVRAAVWELLRRLRRDDSSKLWA